jgi:hypothetical protein
MQQFFNVFIEFVRQAVGAIFRFVAAVWSWAAEQMARLLSMPWHDWPIWRVVLLAFLIYGLCWYLYRSLTELWDAWKKTLAALATMTGVLIKTLPQIVLAGLIALAGVWVLANLDLPDVRPSFMHTGGKGDKSGKSGDKDDPCCE